MESARRRSDFNYVGLSCVYYRHICANIARTATAIRHRHELCGVRVVFPLEINFRCHSNAIPKVEDSINCEDCISTSTRILPSAVCANICTRSLYQSMSGHHRLNANLNGVCPKRIMYHISQQTIIASRVL